MNCEFREDNPSTLLQPGKENSFHPHNDHLRKKMVFCLREELRSPFSTVMEEISDIRRITEICKSTQKSMKKSKECRQYLYHTHKFSLAWHRMMVVFHRTINTMNQSNNSDYRKKQMAEKVIGTTFTHRNSKANIPEAMEKKQKEISKMTYVPKRIEGLHDSKKFDIFDDRIGSKEKQSSTSIASVKTKGESSKGSTKYMRRDSLRPSDFLSNVATTHRNPTLSKESPMSKYSLAETMETSDSDTDLTVIANMHLTQRQQALKLLAEIQLKIEKRKPVEEEVEINARKSVASITPQEALQCAWLRLSKDQVETLEELIRQQGKDPGIHAHSDVTNYDVFAEIREIRRREKAFEEDEEYRR